jgi:uncharacterized membrane protein YidH (DUF202 family)
MPARPERVALVALACAALAIVCFEVMENLEAFAPCRVSYRVHNPVQDSPACKVHGLIGLVSILLIVISLALFFVAAVRWLRSVRRARNRADEPKLR